MERYAKKLAIEYAVNGKSKRKYYPISNMLTDFKSISKAYEILVESVALDISVPPSGEWLLDNFYIIEEQKNIIQKELKYADYKKLPSINGKARIYLLAEELVKYTDGYVDKDNIEKFILAYESKRKLSMEEIYCFPVMIKIALIKYVRNITDRIVTAQYQKFKVASLVERIIKNKNVKEQLFYKYKNINTKGEISSYVEFLVYLLKKEGRRAKKYLDILDVEIKKAGSNTDEIIKTEHYYMALNRVSMSNCISSLKNIIRYSWDYIFETINEIEKTLLKDKAYSLSDNETKKLYRNTIQNISKKTKLSETYIAEQAIEISKDTESGIGDYLIGERQEELFKCLGIQKHKNLNNNQKLFLYLSCIYIPSILICTFLLKEFSWLGIIPVSEVFVVLSNKIISKIKKPTILPRLENIPDGVNTFIIVPTLVKNKERVKEVIDNLETFYLGNRQDNLFFALLGDPSEEDEQKINVDEEIITEGLKDVEKLNNKYGMDKFFFLYRERIYNESQGKWLGYERKRGMITEFVKFLMEKTQGSFLTNSIKNIPTIKYIITLDADTLLPIDTAKKLICTIEHPINKPVVGGKIVVEGFGLIQPRIGMSIEASTATLFSKMYAGDGGIDAYSTAESNVYQDLFGEAIFTGKGIFNVELFHNLLKDEIPENTVLSHDLLEGSYLRCGLASDIVLVDGFPSKVNSYMLRLHRWTRGDWQITKWVFKNSLNKLSKYKILDNLRRSLLDVFLLLMFFTQYYYISVIVIFMPFIIDLIESINKSKIGIKTKRFLPIIDGIAGTFLRGVFRIVVLPYKAFLMLKAISVTLYRMIVSKKKMLEWTTAHDAEKTLKNTAFNYLKEMKICFFVAIALILFDIKFDYLPTFVTSLITTLWILCPIICWLISNSIIHYTERITQKDKEELQNVAMMTWKYFCENMDKNNNYLPPDNYQVGRKNEYVETTSSTNIGLGLMAYISAYDLKLISEEECVNRIKNTIGTILKLEKWNGHLFNWYNIKTLKPLNPRFVSTVDSGNFVGYLYVISEFLKEKNENEYSETINDLIRNTDFSKLYDFEKNLFSTGFDMKEDRIVDSYYDLLASEARLASFVAIAKRDVLYKHWFSMNRALTCVDKYKGLVSWSGTMFEYFMPLIIMKSYPYTLIDEAYDFCIYAQKKYAKILDIPWGISESAFNMQDLNSNYQYKAFGIPWLGLKRGLKEEVVVSPYSCFMALSKIPREVVENIKRLKQYYVYGKYGFFDSIDFTPNRVSQKGYAVVKTYMAHHQALILLSINNYFNNNILQKRFFENKEIKSAELLLEERVPNNIIFTKQKKEKIKTLKYKNYEEHTEEIIVKPCGNVNIQSNNEYTLLINDFGEGYSIYKDKFLTKYNEAIRQGVCLYIKNVENNTTTTNTLKPISEKTDEYEVVFSPSSSKFYKRTKDIEITTKIGVSSEDNVELREVTIKNISQKEIRLDVINYVEPVLVSYNSDIIHPAYNNLFFRAKKYKDAVVLEKKRREDNLYYTCFTISENISQEIELDKMKVIGRLNSIDNPLIAQNDVAFSNDINASTNTIISFKHSITINKDEEKTILFYYGVAQSYKEVVGIYEKYKDISYGKRLFDLAYSKSLIENRFLGYKGKDVLLFNKLYSKIIKNSTRKEYDYLIKQNNLKQCDLWKFGISGDYPIILARIDRVNDIYVIKELISAIEYYNQKNIKVDLIILDEEVYKYEQYVHDKIYEAISGKGAQYLLHKNGGIFVIKKKDINFDEECLLLSCSDLIINARDGFLKEQLYERKD